MSDLRARLGPELADAIEAVIDERIVAALAGLANGTAPPWLTIGEAAEYLRCSSRTIERQLADGRLASTEIGRRRLIWRADLDALGERRQGRT